MKILLSGGTGLIGTKLGSALVEKGHDIVLLVRSLEGLEKVPYPHKAVRWDGEKEAVPSEVFDDIDGVIHLAGVNINQKRWDEAFKKKIKDSRILSTALLLKNAPKNLNVFVGASAIGFYPENEKPMFEDAQPADNFFGQLCQGWESTAYEFLDSDKTRIVHIRTGVVLAPDGGGALGQMLPILKTGLGGPLGDGSQIMSWVDIEDIVGIYVYSLETQKVSGPVNTVAPHPVTNKKLTEVIGKKLNRPVLIPAPKFAIRLAIGEMSKYIMMSQNVSSKKIQALGYKFQYPDINSSLDKNLS